MAIINSTLLLQMFHFGVAYLIVKHLLLKPSVMEIQKEDALQESLVGIVQEHQRSIAQKELEMAHQWQKAREYFASHIPSLQVSIIPFGEKVPEIKIPRFESHTINEYAASAAQQFIKEIEHVR